MKKLKKKHFWHDDCIKTYRFNYLCCDFYVLLSLKHKYQQQQRMCKQYFKNESIKKCIEFINFYLRSNSHHEI